MSQLPRAASDSPPADSFSHQFGFDVLLAALLIVGLIGVYWADRRAPEVAVVPPAPRSDDSIEPEPPPPPPKIALPEVTLPLIDPTRRIHVAFDDELRFGVSTLSGNPDDPDDDNKKLTYSSNGSTNNIRVWIDGYTPILGGNSGRITQPITEIGDRLQSEWLCRDIRFRQTIDYVASDSGRIDSVRVEYRMANEDTQDHEVGIRMMIDSLIGNNDGVPFIVPGRETIVTKPQIFRKNEIPNFIRALEVPNLVNPGVIAELGVIVEGSESPSEVVLTHWPGSSAAWDYGRARPFRHDTAIGLYYAPNRLPPGTTRTVSFSYGLGTISSTRTKNARLSLMARGPFRAGGQFWVVALVQNPESGQQVRLELAKGLTFDAQHEATKELKAGSDYAQLSWLVHIAPSALGKRTLTAFTEPDDISEAYDIEVQPRDTGMTLIMSENVKSGRAFWVSAFVRYARDEQTVELTLPAEFKLREGHTTKTLTPKKDGYSRIDWLVEAPGNKTGNFVIAVKLWPDGPVEKVAGHVQSGSLIE